LQFARCQFALEDLPRLLSASDSAEALLRYNRKDFVAARVNLEQPFHAGDAAIAGSLFLRDLQP